jgi:probable rRNA maturation factor
VNSAVIDIALVREDKGWPPEDTLMELAETVISAACRELKLLAGDSCELSLVFAGDAMIKSLNAQWRGKDTPTNVLSFPSFALKPGEALPAMLGDIVLARETLVREALAESKTFENHASHLLLHGFLHLLGYDHETEADALVMEAAETRILASLAIPDPYAVIADPS